MHILPFGERYCFRPGPIPPTLGNLRSLSLLFLDRNQLSGERCWWGGVRDIYIYIYVVCVVAESLFHFPIWESRAPAKGATT